MRKVEVPGYVPPNGKPMSLVVDAATPDYFKTLGIAMLKGREFTWADTASSRLVMLVNQQFVDEYFRSREALGATVNIDWKTAHDCGHTPQLCLPGSVAGAERGHPASFDTRLQCGCDCRCEDGERCHQFRCAAAPSRVTA